VLMVALGVFPDLVSGSCGLTQALPTPDFGVGGFYWI
jgi:hypothetical protein